MPKQTEGVAEYIEPTSLEQMLEGRTSGGPVIAPDTPFPGHQASFDEEYLDAGQVISQEFMNATENAVDGLFHELLSQPPDADSKADQDRREHLMTLPHEPDEFFMNRPKIFSSYIELLKVHVVKGLVKEGFNVYQTGVQEGILTPCLTTYSLLISLCGSAVVHDKKTTIDSAPSRFKYEATKALELFTEARERGLVPNEYVYGSLIATLSKLEHLDQAFKVLEMVKYQGLEPNCKMYTSLIVGCYKLDQYDRAFEVFMEMRINGQEPDVTTYNMMMRIEAKKKAPEGALGYMTQLEHFGHVPDVQSYALCIYSCANRPDYHEKAFELYDLAMAKGYHPTRFMLSSLLFVTSNMGDIETAKLLFDQFTSYKIPRDHHAYSLMIRTVAKKIHQDFYTKHDGSKMKRHECVLIAETYFDEFLATGEQPVPRKILNSMLSVYTKGKQMVKAEEFRNVVFAKNGQRLDFYSYLALIAMYARIKSLDKCYATFLEMKSVGLKPDYDVYMLVLRTCKHVHSDFLGAKVLKEMCDNGIVADEDAAYPFKEIVESLPDYKAPPSLVPERGVAVNEGLGLREDRLIEQAKRQQQLMLQDPESLSLLERTRKSKFNDYNPNSFHPSNPEFVRNYVNRKRVKSLHLLKPPLWPRAKNYREGMLGDPDPQAKLVGEKLIDHNMKEIRGLFLLAGGEKIHRDPIPTRVRVKRVKNPPRIEQ